jgi:hypothetical protein
VASAYAVRWTRAYWVGDGARSDRRWSLWANVDGRSKRVGTAKTETELERYEADGKLPRR